jgi:hypothetical protein
LVKHVRASAPVQPPTNASIADLAGVEVAWRNWGELRFCSRQIKRK